MIAFVESGQKSTPAEVSIGPTVSITDALKSLVTGNDVRRVYGEPIVKENRTIIPIADVGSTFGFGSGSGVNDESGHGEGGGGGGKLSGRPIGFLEITDESTRFVPTFDASRVAKWAIAAGAFLLWMIIRKF